MLGVAAGIVVGVIEVAYVLATAGASFDGALETGRFVGLTLATLAGAGALAGVVQGLIGGAIAYASSALGDPRRDQSWQARLYTALAVPPVALVCAQIFRGPYARTIAHHDLYALAIGVGALLLFFVALRGWQRVYGGNLAPGAAWLAGAVCLAAAILCYAVDQRVLVRLYPFFHAGLGVMTFAAAELAIAIVSLATRRRHVRLLEPRNAAFIGIVAVAAGAASLHAMAGQRALRTVVLERTVLTAPVLRACGRAPTPAHTGGVAPVVAVTLPDGPHLGAVDVFLITVDAMRADRLTSRTAPGADRARLDGRRLRSRLHASAAHLVQPGDAVDRQVRVRALDARARHRQPPDAAARCSSASATRPPRSIRRRCSPSIATACARWRSRATASSTSSTSTSTPRAAPTR